MNASTAWSTQAAPLAGIAGAAVFSLGVVCIVHAAVTLALGGAAWNLPAYACMALAALLAVVHSVRAHHRHSGTLYRDADGGYRLSGHAGVLALVRVWLGPAWVTLRLKPQALHDRPVHVVLWKSAIPSPLWSELVLQVQAGPPRRNRHQNKENP